MPSKPSTPRTLGFAIWSDNVALVRKLLDAGAPVDNYGSDTVADVTPLMESVDELEPYYDASRLVLTQLLLSAGADVARRETPDVLPCTMPSGLVAWRSRFSSRRVRMRTPPMTQGVTPLHEAIVRGNVSAIEALCQGGANGGARDHTGRTPADLLSENKDVFTSEELAAVNPLLGSTSAPGNCPVRHPHHDRGTGVLSAPSCSPRNPPATRPRPSRTTPIAPGRPSPPGKV